MCGVTELTLLSIATTGFTVYQQNQAAKSTFKAQHKQAEAALEEQQSAAEEDMGQRLKQFRKQRARARVAGGESGAQGQSYAVALNQSLQDQDEVAGIISKNLSLGQRSKVMDLAAANSQVRTVSGLEAGLQIASSATSTYYSAKKAEKSTTKE
jgi:hypothetical protein